MVIYNYSKNCLYLRENEGNLWWVKNKYQCESA